MEILSTYGPYVLVFLAIVALLGHLLGSSFNRSFQRRYDRDNRRAATNMAYGRERLSLESKDFRCESYEERENRLLALKKSSGMNIQCLEDDTHGIFGEAAMAAFVARAATDDRRRHILLHNVYVPARSGTTEIDVLLLHESGIYVFESKNISGEISGTLELERWEQILNEKVKHTFHNPLQQNQGHINALRHFLQLGPRENFTVSYIVFSDRCLLKKVPADGRFFKIVHCSELGQSLYSFLKTRRSVYSFEQLETWFSKLYPCAHASEAVKAEHNAWVQNKRGGVSHY